MKKGLILSALLLALLSISILSGCGGPYVRKDLEAVYKPKVQRVALLPFKNLETNPKASNAHIGLREGVYHELKKKDMEFTSVIQPLAETDNRLSEAGLAADNLGSKTAYDLGQILQVDAVVQGTSSKYEEKGKAGQWATLILLGGAVGAEIICRINITDCSSQNLLWDWELKQKGPFLSSPESVANQVGKKVAKKWPFKKKK